MTNADDVFGELAAARAYIIRGKLDRKCLDVAVGCIDQALKLITAEFAALIADVIEAEKAAGTVIAEYDNGVPIFWCREPGCQLPGEHMGGHSSRVMKYDHAAVEEAQQAADEAYQAATSAAHAGLAADIQKIMEPRA